MSRIRRPISFRRNVILWIAGVSSLIIGYEFLSYRQHVANPTDTTIPSFSQLYDGLMSTLTVRENPLISAFGGVEEEKSWWAKINSTWLVRDVLATYSRLIKGLVLGSILSAIIGVVMGCYESVAAILEPPLSFLAKIPGTAMLAVFFVMVGTGEVMFGTMIGFGILPTLTQAIYLSAKHDLHDEEINKAYTLGASNMEVIWNVVFKQILPKLLENVRLQIGPAMVYLIAAEMLVGQVGMGYQIRMQQRLLNMAIVYDYLIILGVTGLMMDQGMLWFRRWMCPWFSRYK